jgi:uncharacterized phiE125 gp8 family phage protein
VTDLTTLADVKAYLKITNTTDDAVLNRLITAASTFMRSWLNRDITQQTYTETRDGRGSTKLAMKNYPVTAVSSLAIDGLTIPQSTTVTTPGWCLDDSGILIQLRGGVYFFSKGMQNVTVTYTAGFATVPYDIAQCCIEMVAYRYKESDRIGVSAKTLAGEVISYSQRDVPPASLTIMTQYKRVFTL